MKKRKTFIKKRLKDLAKQITEHNYNYHTLDNPKISDKDFDKLVKENEILEKEFPHLVLKNSPNKIYGSKVKENFQKIVHNSQMYSLANAFDNKDVEEFIKRSINHFRINNIPKNSKRCHSSFNK